MRQDAGFTLVEVMVALSIFALVGVMCTGLLVSTLDARERQAAAMEQLGQLQQIRALWREDAAHMVMRPHRSADGGYDGPALAGPQGGFLSAGTGATRPLAVFTRRGRANPSGVADRSSLIRVDWRVEDGALVREVWTTIDPAPGSVPQRMVLASGLEDVSVRFRFGRNWLDNLPRSSGSDAASMPQALALSYADDRGREIDHVALTSLATGGAS